ncbi:MAG: hypothetical protein JW747_02155 [Candidatus Aminicenantes bacterium]|nr:hypothetical protein [Candidatus Aminicenantes bacterium]
MNLRRTPVCLLLVFLLSVSAWSASEPTAPATFLGHEVGADRKLADANQIQAYFEKLDAESPRLKLLTIGKSTLGKPMIMAVISSESNMARLDEFRSITRKLRDAELSDEEALALARKGKALVLITCSLHATEIAASQMSLELAYNLVTGKTPFDADKVLEDVVVLLVPTSNPDGHQMITEWYRKYVGTKYEGGAMPWLYHHYAGHDNNRDWFMFNLPETRAVTSVLYHDWLPQVHIDEHQMGSTGARLFLPPFMDPPVPNVQPLLWRGVNLMGSSMCYDLQQNGFSGVEHGRSFTGWWIGACDDTSWLHNVIGLLSEMASVRVASPIYIEPNELSDEYYEKRMSFLDPWPGGWWRLRDIVDYELTLSLSLIETSSLRKNDLLFNFYSMNRASIKDRAKGEPYAYVVPAGQHDGLTALKMLRVLQFGGVKIHRTRKDFTVGSTLYPAGSHVILLSQPYKPYAWALLQRQKYPDIRQYPGGPPVPPYDNAAWTLPLQMGVACDEIMSPFEADLEKLEVVPPPAVESPGESPYWVLDARLNTSFAAAFALLKEGAEIFRSESAFTAGSLKAPAGSFIVRNSAQALTVLPGLLEKWGLTAYALDDLGGIPVARIKNPRVGLYQSWRSNMDEGWTRCVLDDLGVSYRSLHNSDFKPAKGSKEKRIDLKAAFDVIVFADESADIIKTGKPSPDSPWARYYRQMAVPPEYEGGIEQAGVDALKTFVEKGGIVVALNEACLFASRELGAPARSALERVDRTKFFCPTSILKIEVDNTSPLGYGMPEEAAAVFADSVALDTWVPPVEWDRRVVARFPEDEMLMSGWLLGEDVISRKAAVVDTQYKRGHIILIGIRCQHRAQSHGTYKFLLNALLYPQPKS